MFPKLPAHNTLAMKRGMQLLEAPPIKHPIFEPQALLLEAVLRDTVRYRTLFGCHSFLWQARR